MRSGYSLCWTAAIGELFKSEIPESVPGYELSAEDGKNMTQLWPAGYKAAEESLNKFAKAKEESVKAEKDPKKGEKEKQQMADDGKKVLINGYADGRSRVDQPNTSRISFVATLYLLYDKLMLGRVEQTLPLSWSNQCQTSRSSNSTLIQQQAQDRKRLRHRNCKSRTSPIPNLVPSRLPYLFSGCLR